MDGGGFRTREVYCYYSMKCKEEIDRTINEEKAPSKTRPNQSLKHSSHTKPILRLGWYLQVLIATATKKPHYMFVMA